MLNKTLLFVTSFPPRECGIATFAQDLVNSLHKSFAGKLKIDICALSEAGKAPAALQGPVKYVVDPFNIDSCIQFAHQVNADEKIDLVCFEHEFGLYGGEYGHNMLAMLSLLDKPFVVRFHTVLPYPDAKCLKVVSIIGALASKIIAMTQTSAEILLSVYHLPADKIVHIPHGVHARITEDMAALKKQYGLQNKKVLTTFGLLSENKGLETAIRAMQPIAQQFPDTVYLILGKTHPVVLAREGEQYRQRLEQLIAELGLEEHVRFVNSYLSLDTLLDYLALTDIYLFTSKDPHQAVSGTFLYAMSAGCPIVSTAFSQAREMLDECCGYLIEMGSHEQLAQCALRLLGDPELRKRMSSYAIEKTRSAIWDNVAIAHMSMFNEILAEKNMLLPSLPPAYLDHMDRMTDEFGMIQFSRHDQPDPSSGYTLDDNARALIAMCMYVSNARESSFVYSLCHKYLDFIEYCQQPTGRFLNYVNVRGYFDPMNYEVNLEDANGRAVWALGYLLQMEAELPPLLVQQANRILQPCFNWLETLTSPRAMAFAIKGLYYYMQYRPGGIAEDILHTLAGRLHKIYQLEADAQWKWYEPYLTYGNAVLPEAMMMAYQVTGNTAWLQIARESLDFLCSKTFTDNYMKVISNKTWYHKHTNDDVTAEGGEQSIEVAYTMLTLHTFFQVTGNHAYMEKMRLAFSWYLGNNHLKQLIYNPLTYGCYDGLEKNNVNQNQGAESSVCYLIARLLMEQWNKHKYVTTQKTGIESGVRLSLN
ncbi:glycosyltransferase [Chitinophaga agrisoli]|uniref:Glycosyltransferase n=1 Tax=Chitinophaga agrisoli TaxID=2607653 RepID=A0A5B2W3V8_9BACT|nr:glycosyltransferase [Chitinophaga agrisoli]KAA2245236.1 glycosyltransferase [Chitinophaga agrisoli]